MSTWLKILLFVAGGTVAAAGTAYLTGALDPWMEPEAPIVAALPDQDARPLPEAEPAAVVEEDAEPAAEPVATGDEEERTPAAETDEIIAPRFDIVRVEPDGSMVIAGHAAPEAAIEVVTGTRVIAAARADAGGDFAAVLDRPLAPGDYQIVLRATTRDNVVATSVETAVVSIPETSDGQVLALVEQPGTPSRLITVPEPVEPASEIDVAEGPELIEEETAEVATEEIEVVEEEAQPAVAEVPAEPEAAEEEVAEAPAEAVEEEAAEVAELPEEAAETETARADEPAEAEEEIAALPEDAEPEATEPAVQARVFVEAVEIDGGTVFVAGRAEAGRYVRVYANEIVLGETQASEGGRFLIEATVDLPVGDYIIRADLLGGDGSVIARAAVPFEREPGEAIAAVAPPASAPVETEAAEQPAEEAATEIAEMAEEVSPEAESGVEIAEGSATEAEVDIAMSDQPAENEVAAEPEPVIEEETEAPAGIAEAPAAAEPDETEIASESEEAMPEPAAEVAEAEAEPEIEVAAAPVEETLSPALERADGAVIIRRGDNLWRISRRVYGHGIRYSTIYLANQEQIRNPDLIWPGQVFNVPAETDQGEMADLEALGEQAVDPSMVPGEIELYR